MTRPDYQMISHMALLRMLHRKGEFRVGSCVEEVGGESRWSLAVGWNWEVLGLIGVFCLAHAGLGLDVFYATN